MEYPWSHSRRFNAYVNFSKSRFGTRVQKLSIDAGFSCPNRDGSLASGGCSFCNNEAFNPSYCQTKQSIAWQIETGKQFHKKRYRTAENYLVYFQAYSNTYAPLSVLKERYEEALACQGVVGLVVGTRPDCLNEEIISYLAELSKKYFVQLEIGIESCYDATLLRVNRGHDFACTRNAFELAHRHGLVTGGHLILGLPGESKEQILEEAAMISQIGLHSLKLHQLQILKGSKMEKEYEENPDLFDFFELSEYIDFVIDFLERLSPSIYMERFAGEVPPRFQKGPAFGSIRNEQIVSRVEKRLEERNTWQGRLYKV